MKVDADGYHGASIGKLQSMHLEKQMPKDPDDESHTENSKVQGSTKDELSHTG